MPLQVSRRGTRIRLEFPFGPWPELKEKHEIYTRLIGEETMAWRSIQGLQNKREHAIERDKRAYAAEVKKAAEAGQRPPEETHSTEVEDIDKQIAETTRRAEAITLALDGVEQDIVDLVHEHRDEWVADALTRVGAAYETYAALVDQVTQARNHVSQAWSLWRFASAFPEKSRAYAPGLAYMHTLKAPHGDPYRIDEVMEALRRDAVNPGPADDSRSIPFGLAADLAITGVPRETHERA